MRPYLKQLAKMADGGTVLRGPNSLTEKADDWAHDRGLPTSMEASDLDANPVGVAAASRAVLGGSASPSSRVKQGFDIVGKRTVRKRGGKT